MKSINSGSPDLVAVSLANGVELVGAPPSEEKLASWRAVLSRREVQNFGFSLDALELIEESSRYYIPRSLPGSSLKTLDGKPVIFPHKEDPARDFAIHRQELLKLAQRLRPKAADICVDIGAMWGFGTLRLAELVGPRGQIFAFEPNPDSFRVLQENMARNGAVNVVCMPYAASDIAKEDSMFWTDGVPSGNSLHREVIEERVSNELSPVTVTAVRPDEVLKSLGVSQVHFASITVNGGEPEALRGLSSVIDESPEFAISAAGWYGRDGFLVADLLETELSEHKMSHIYKGKKGRIVAWKDSPSGAASASAA